ncbi:MAG: hypothetical protein QM662_08980 [Gordonia sp. (in: high G+C Gram-positive bacteria)]
MYGASAGAINAAWLVSSRPEGAEGWRDPRFAEALIDVHNLLRRRPVVDDVATLRCAIQASAALPVAAGRAVTLAGRQYYDAGLAESVPYRLALKDGASHVLVLRSRRIVDLAGPDQPSQGSRLFVATLLQGTSPGLRAAYLERDRRLRDDDRCLADLDTAADSTVLSIRPAEDSPRVGRLESRGEILEPAFDAGREAVRRRLADVVAAACRS